MAYSLHTTKTYQVQYGRNAVNGWDEIEKFIKFLKEKSVDVEPYPVYVDEGESYVDIDFDFLESLKDDETWGNTIQLILDDSDNGNGYGYAHLEVW